MNKKKIFTNILDILLLTMLLFGAYASAVDVILKMILYKNWLVLIPLFLFIIVASIIILKPDKKEGDD